MRYVRRWWAAAEAVCARLAQPPIDVDVADADAAQLWRESWIGSRVSIFVGRIQADWMASRCRDWVRSVTSDQL